MIRRETAIAALLYALLATLAFGRSFLPDRLFVPMHTGRFEPWRSTTHADEQESLAAGEFDDASDKLISFRSDDQLTADAFRDGRVPLWNPSNAGGVPHLGQGLYGVFYPFHWIYRWLEPESAYGFLAALHHFLAALFTFLYVRRIGGRFGGSLFAGIAFSFSTCLLARAHYYQYIESACWIPLGLIAVEAWVRHGSRRALGALAIVVALILLVGWPQMAAFACFLFMVAALVRSISIDLRATGSRLAGSALLVFALFLAASAGLKDPLPLIAGYPATVLLAVFFASPGRLAFAKRMTGIVFALLGGAAIAAVQYAPMAEWMVTAGTRRGSAPEMLVGFGLGTGLRPTFLFELLFAGVFGLPGDAALKLDDNLLRAFAIPVDDMLALGADMSKLGSILENACYFGLLPLLLVTIGLLSRSPRRMFLVIALVWFLGFALGSKWIVYPAWFGGFFVGTDPRRALPVAVFAASCLAGLGFDALVRRPRLGLSLAVVPLLLLAMVAAIAHPFREAAFGVVEDHARAVFAAFGLNYAREPLALSHFGLCVDRILAGLLVVAPFAAVALVLWTRRRLPRSVRVGAVVVALAVDLAIAGRPFLATQPARGFLASAPLIEHLRSTVGREGRLAHAVFVPPAIPTLVPVAPNFAGCFGLLDAWCYTVSPPRRWMRLADSIFSGWPLVPPDAEHPTIVGGVHPPPLTEVAQLSSRALDLMAVKAILGHGEPPAELPAGISLDARFGECFVLKKENALPRVFTVGAVEVMEYARDDQVANRVLDPALDLRSTAVLEVFPGPFTGDGELPEARIVSDTGEDLVVRLEPPAGSSTTGRGGLLVVLDTWANGWKAEVDGNAAPVLRTDFAFRGVKFPAGAREVRLSYRPTSFRVGAAISIAALVLAMFIVFRGTSARR